jgi:hypothetical protein
MPQLREEFTVDLSDNYVVSLHDLLRKTKAFKTCPQDAVTPPEVSGAATPLEDARPATSSVPQGQKYDLIAR